MSMRARSAWSTSSDPLLSREAVQPLGGTADMRESADDGLFEQPRALADCRLKAIASNKVKPLPRVAYLASDAYQPVGKFGCY